jgi:hypothetical protein
MRGEVTVENSRTVVRLAITTGAGLGSRKVVTDGGGVDGGTATTSGAADGAGGTGGAIGAAGGAVASASAAA